MKLRRVFIVTIVLLMLLTVSSFAYNGDGWSIDLNEEEYDILTQDGIAIFQQKGKESNLLIQKIEQKVFGGKLTEFQLNVIMNGFKTQYEQLYGATCEELGRSEFNANGQKFTRLKFKLQIDELVMYQEINILITDDYLYELVFSSEDENTFSEEYKTSLLQSFKVETDNTVLFQILALVVLAVAIVLIVVFSLIQLKKKKKAKTQETNNQ